MYCPVMRPRCQRHRGYPPWIHNGHPLYDADPFDSINDLRPWDSESSSVDAEVLNGIEEATRQHVDAQREYEKATEQYEEAKKKMQECKKKLQEAEGALSLAKSRASLWWSQR